MNITWGHLKTGSKWKPKFEARRKRDVGEQKKFASGVESPHDLLRRRNASAVLGKNGTSVREPSRAPHRKTDAEPTTKHPHTPTKHVILSQHVGGIGTLGKNREEADVGLKKE